jgi:light-regulated signal transduction histidine kinase (bacteriophytochrome)
LHKNYLEQGGKSIRMGRFASAITKNGTEISIDASLNTFTAGGKRFIIVILQDITELKKHQDTILQQNEALRSIAWEQSHKLRTPVANILSLCDLLTNSDGESEEEKSLYIQFLIESAKSLDVIVHKIVGQANENEFNGQYKVQS